MADRASYLSAAFVLAPAVILSQVVVQNGLAVLFPAWVAVGASRARGIDAMGQRLLMLAGMLFALVVSLVPGVIAAAAFAFLAYQVTGTVLILLPAFIVAVIVAGECWLVSRGARPRPGPDGPERGGGDGVAARQGPEIILDTTFID